MKISDQKNPARPQIGGYVVAIALSTGLTLTAIRAFPRVFLPTDNKETTQNKPQSQLVVNTKMPKIAQVAVKADAENHRS